MQSLSRTAPGGLPKNEEAQEIFLSRKC